MKLFRLVLLGLAACIVAVLGLRLHALHLPAPAIVIRPSPPAVPPQARLPPAVPPPIVPPQAMLPQAVPPPIVPPQTMLPQVAAKPPEAAAPPVETQPPTEPPPQGGYATARAFIEQKLGEVPEFTDFYMKLLVDFPRNYARGLDTYAHLRNENKPLPSADTILWDMFRDLQQSQGLLAAQADAARLRAFFDARLAVLDAMAPVDVRLCADFLYGITDAPFEAFTKDHRPLIAALAVTQLAAIKDGQQRRVERTNPSTDDFNVLASGLAARHLSTDEIAVLLDGKTVDPPTPETRLCEMGRIYLQVLRDLPAEAQQRIYGLAAELLARS